MSIMTLVPRQRNHATASAQSSADISAARPRGDGRDRYIDTLRALALVRVVTYHLFGWAWLPMLFPSMAVMFALAGGLVAASLSRASHWTMFRKRLRRLLPPLWALGAILVPTMIFLGWTYDPATYDGQPLTWHAITNWIVPFYTPGASAWGEPFASPLWYLSAYMWLLFLSPALLWLWCRWPLRTIAAPLIAVAMFSVGLFVSTGSRTDEMSLILVTYGACWMLGFAHHHGTLRRLAVSVVVPVAGALIALGLGLAYAFPDPELGPNIDAIPIANALYGLGYALLLLRFYPSFDWMRRHRVLDGLISAINARAMTIYLWHNIAVASAIALERQYAAGNWYEAGDVSSRRLVQYACVWVLIGLAVLAIGWVEDVAAKRPARLLPLNRSDRPRRRRTAAKMPSTPGVLVASGPDAAPAVTANR